MSMSQGDNSASPEMSRENRSETQQRIYIRVRPRVGVNRHSSESTRVVTSRSLESREPPYPVETAFLFLYLVLTPYIGNVRFPVYFSP